MEILKKYFGLVFFLLSLGWMLKVLLLPGYPDYQVHYFGAQHLVQRENPYQADDNYFTSQVYPPFDMVFFIPLSFFPYEFSSKIWIIISLIAIFASIYLLNIIEKETIFSQRNLFLASLVFLSFPVKFSLGMGQINPIIVLFTTLLLFYLHKKENSKAGIVFAFPLMLKFFPLLFVPYFLFLKKWKVLFSLAFSILILFLISLFFVSFQTYVYFFQVVLPDLLASWKGDYYNQALTGVLMRGIPDVQARQLLRIVIPILLVSITAVVLVLQRKRTQKIINLELSSLIVLSLLINNFSWQHHFILLLVPFYCIFYAIKNDMKNKKLYAILTVCYLLVAINVKDPKNIPIFFQSHVFWGTLLLWCMNMYLLMGRKSRQL